MLVKRPYFSLKFYYWKSLEEGLERVLHMKMIPLSEILQLLVETPPNTARDRKL